MKICVIGAGYVGLTAGACLSEIGHNVICVDNDKVKINNLKKSIMPFFEPELFEIVSSNLKRRSLSFSLDISDAIKKSNVCFIAVGTPQKPDGSCDLSSVFDVAKQIGKSINGYKLIVNKSTSLIGTTEKIKKIIQLETSSDIDVIVNPEFLSQGSAVKNFLKPDRLIIGATSQRAIEIFKKIYSPLLIPSERFVVMDEKSAEMTKYASNIFLATKISYMNEIANLCEKVGANINNVKLGMSYDNRIGDKFLNSGIGFGGSCFPKDIEAILSLAKEFNCNLDIVSSVGLVNKNQRKIFLNKILNKFNNNISNKVFSIWGLSFKPDTSDVRCSPSIDIISFLLDCNAKINVYDPKANNNIKDMFKDKISYFDNPYEALQNADALIILTDWKEFLSPDFNKIKTLLKTSIIFDGRNLYDKNYLLSLGIEYFGIGV